MKKAEKKTAKKAPPPKKLIDGKYESVFTMRLEPPEAKLLNDLKPDLREKTDSAAIRALINRYNPTMQELIETRKQLNEVSKQMNTQANLLLYLKNGLKQLQELRLVELVFNDERTHCDSCGTKLNDYGDCPHFCDLENR